MVVCVRLSDKILILFVFLSYSRIRLGLSL